MKKFDVGHFSDSEGKSEENLPDPDKLRSFEAEALGECLERAKSSLSGISQSAKQLFSDDAGTLLATERMDISSLDLENLKKASNEENFYFPLLSADLRKKEFASVEIRRDKKLILDSIKQDLVELAIRLSEVSPILSELMTGIPSSISESLKLFSTSQRRNWLTENSFSLKVHPLAKLIEFKDKNSFFNYLYQYIALNSKTQYKPLSSVGESLEIFQSNVLNTNYADPDDSFFRRRDIENGAFLLNFDVDRILVADATNFWKLRVLAAPVRDKASKADFSKIDGANPEAEATYRIFLALYNLLSSSKINKFTDIRAFATALSFIKILAENTDRWAQWSPVKIDPTAAFTILTYQTFNWFYDRIALNMFDRAEVDETSYTKFCRLKSFKYPLAFALLTKCPACGHDFLATNTINYFRVCPICDSKVLI